MNSEEKNRVKQFNYGAKNVIVIYRTIRKTVSKSVILRYDTAFTD